MAQSIGIETEGKSTKEIALELYEELERTYTQIEGEIPFAKRVPEKTLETWRKLGIVPRGAMREIMELIKNDILVLQTGCSQIALAKNGLCTPEAAYLAGPGLREVCETVGMPPVLGLGSCVDNSRILIAASEMVRTGGLGDSIADLPVAGAAPEWMSEKAISIGHYFVASGVFTAFGVTFPIVQDTKFHKLLFDGLERQGLGKWAFTPDPHEMAQMMIAHIDKKRKALGIDKSRERALVDMADRREMDAA